MVIDLSIIHDGASMTVKSEAAKYHQTKPATIGLSKDVNYEGELIEGVGESWTTADLQSQAKIERGEDNRTYRVINPFLAKTFEPNAAFMTVRYYCLRSHLVINPRTYQWRALLRLDSFDVTLKLLDYHLISVDKRKMFEKELSKITKQFKID